MPEAAAAAAAQRILRSRNGRPLACEPCRRRKVACDNNQPVCLRCSKRRRQDDCVYATSAADLTNVARPSAAERLGPSERMYRIRRPASSSLHPRAPNHGRRAVAEAEIDRLADFSKSPVSNGHSTGDTPKPNPPTRVGSLSSTCSPLPASSQPIGYLGSTAYTSVYQETSTNLSKLQGNAPSVDVLPDPSSEKGNATPVDSSAASIVLTSPTRETCFVALRNLPPLDGRVIEWKDSPHPADGWVRLLSARVLASFNHRLGRRSAQELDDAEIEELALELSANSYKAVPVKAALASDWMDHFVGENLRWESLGLLYCFADLNDAQRLQQNRLFWRDSKDDDQWRQIARKGIRLCIELAKSFNDGNLLLMYLCHRRTIMESMASGDAAIACWRAHADSVSLLTFMGLHAEPDGPSYVPTFGSELRRRIFAYTFNMDKAAVSFQGRPPLLSTRFVTTPLPLDIPDVDFVGDAPTFQRAVSKVDGRGWAVNGEMTATTLIRAFTSISFVKDELLELALSHNRVIKLETLLDIKERARALMKGFPQCVAYHPEDLGDRSIDVKVLYCRMLIQIEHLKTLFFAERLLLRQPNLAYDSELLLVSYDMVSLSLTFWMRRDRFSNVGVDLEWLMMNYAAPGGGILCNELLRPTFPGNTHPVRSDITRSGIIQQLSLLVGFLSWVTPGEPNADLCHSCRAVIQRVLDYTLSNLIVPDQEAQQQAQETATTSLGDFVGQFADMDALNFNLDLMDAFDWLRPEEVGSDL